jgi:hypothetical protein
MSTDYYYYDTNLVGAQTSIKEDFVFPTIPKKDNFLFFYYSTEILKPQFIEYVQQSLNFKIDTVFLFYKAVNINPKLAHCDLYDKTTIATNALNWCISEPNGKMLWYDYPTSADDIQMGVNNKGIEYPYMLVNVENMKPIADKVIGKEPTLVRTDKLHAIDVNDTPRWTISCRSNLTVIEPWKNLSSILNISYGTL